MANGERGRHARLIKRACGQRIDQECTVRHTGQHPQSRTYVSTQRLTVSERLVIRALGNSYTTQGQCSAGHGCWDHEPTRAGLYAAGGSSHGVGRRLADLRAAMEAFGNAVGNTCSRLHLGGESARTCNQAARRWRLIIYLRMKSLGTRPSYIDSDQNNKTFLSYPILS